MTNFLILSSRMLATVIWLSTWLESSLALAETTPAPPAEKGYTLPYLLVVLGIALGLIAVCRPVRRGTEAKLPELKDDE